MQPGLPDTGRDTGHAGRGSDRREIMPAGSSGRLQISQIDWSKVERVLVIKLRSIGDTVLSTPSLIALKRFVPNAQIDILLEDWVAPLLVGSDVVDHVLSV